jgi:formylglycine-generating enzyme required for sulfatase activity
MATKRFETDRQYELALEQYSPVPDGPWIGATWYAAAAYANWLSEREGLPRDEWCYQPTKLGEYENSMTVPANVLSRKGYRLPTEAEWEYACRAGSSTSRYHGDSVDLLGKYGWYLTNDGKRSWPVGTLLPNDLGLFDVLGNVYEWCQDPKKSNEIALGKPFHDLVDGSEIINDANPRAYRGGTYAVPAAILRSAHRDFESPRYGNIYTGFRLVRTVP